MPEVASVFSQGVNGALRFQNYQAQDILTIGATTGIPFGSYYQTVSTITAATSLTAVHCGKLINCTTDAVVVTLPSQTIPGVNYSITNTASDGGALLVIKTAAGTDYIVGDGGTATTNLVVANTKATQRYGDSISLIAMPSTAAGRWVISGIIGTWALAATS